MRSPQREFTMPDFRPRSLAFCGVRESFEPSVDAARVDQLASDCACDIAQRTRCVTCRHATRIPCREHLARLGTYDAVGTHVIHGIRRDTMVEVLLNTLEVERNARQALLSTVIDELSASADLEPAADNARSLLSLLEAGLADSEFRRRVGDLRDLVGTLCVRGQRVIVAR